jgi:CDP-diglyceride synthetase
MRRLTPVVLAAAGVLVALDIVGALAGKPLGFPYPPLGAVSLLIYLSVGLLGALRGNFVTGIIGAAAVGFLDGTLGPLAAWMVGPGPVGQTFTEPRVFAYGIAVVTVTAAAAGVIGALAGSWLERRRGLRSSSGMIPR